MKRTMMVLLSLVLMLSLFALYGCPKKAEVASSPEEQKVEQAPAKSAEDIAAEKAAAEKRAAEAAAAAARAAEEAKAREAAAKAAAGLQPIYFDFDKSFVRDDAKAVMKANA
jgi:outer membrane protein OmpA-like peptidoglycan-associated protein